MPDVILSLVSRLEWHPMTWGAAPAQPYQEVLAVNTAAPFVLNGKLRGLMARAATLPPLGSTSALLM